MAMVGPVVANYASVSLSCGESLNVCLEVLVHVQWEHLSFPIELNFELHLSNHKQQLHKGLAAILSVSLGKQRRKLQSLIRRLLSGESVTLGRSLHCEKS